MARIPSPPSYPKKPHKGHARITVRLIDGNRKDLILGQFRSPESRVEYARILAELESNGGRYPVKADGTTGSDLTVNELALAYFQHAEGYYVKDGRPTTQLDRVKRSLRPVKKLYGHTLARAFGPLALKAAREQLVKVGWARGYINACVGCMKRMFKWGVENELIPPSVYHGLLAVEGLKKGRTKAPERRKVLPVADEYVDATTPFMTTLFGRWCNCNA